MADLSDFTQEASPATTDHVVGYRTAASGGERRFLISAIRALFKTYFDTVYAALTHTHAQGDVTGLTAALAAKADDAATTTALSGKAATSHSHAQSDVTGLTAALDAKASLAALAAVNASGVNSDGLVEWSQLVGVPAGFADGSDDGSGGGSGDVVGPASSTAERPALFDGTTGKLLKQASAALGTAAFAATSAFDAAGSAAAAQAAAIAASQPLDSDLTAIAALTTTSYGRAFLALADAPAARSALSLPVSLGFGFDGGGEVVATGSKFKRVISAACTITGWRLVGDVSGSVSLDVKKGTPSGGSVTLSSIVAAAAPALSSQQVVSSTTLTGWTTALAAGDVVEVSITGSPATITSLAFSLDVTLT